MCDFSIEYPKSKDDMVGQLRAAIEGQADGVLMAMFLLVNSLFLQGDLNWLAATVSLVILYR